jgi:alpha-tubulin suppressor-like RCC1 family protein
MLGDETTIHRSSPVQVGSATNWTKLTTGDYCCLAINDAGELWAWGKNEGGQMGLGEGTDVRSSSPAQVGSLTTWVDVRSRGTGTTRAIKTAS